MTISNAVHNYLNRAGVPYEVMLHERTDCALQTARAADVPADMLAKGVLLRRSDGYLLAIVPASRQVRLNEVGRCLHGPVCLATEPEVTKLFDDCEPGSIPPLGEAFGIMTVIDESLVGLPDIFFEGGDHYSLIHVSGSDFHELTEDVLHARICTRH